MFKIIVFSLCLWSAHGYFTLPGKCPNVTVVENFRLNDFFGKWYQAYYYSSDGQKKNKCSTIEINRGTDNVVKNYPLIYFNQSRVDTGLLHKYSVAIVKPGSRDAHITLSFKFPSSLKILEERNYEFLVLATNYNDYATAYTCQYSPLIDKHFVYVWILSKHPILNDASKELALRPLQQLGLNPAELVKDDFSECNPKSYKDFKVEPATFRYPVPVQQFLNELTGREDFSGF